MLALLQARVSRQGKFVSFQAVSCKWSAMLQADNDRLDSILQGLNHPQESQAWPSAASGFHSPARYHSCKGRTAGAVLAAVAGAGPPSVCCGRVAGCEGGHCQAKGEGSLGSKGTAVLAAAACLSGLESCCGRAVQPSMQAAGDLQA